MKAASLAFKIMWGDIGDAATKRASQETLYTCLDVALKLSAPFMPYVTEELWQRLPRRAGDVTPSIHVSSWPEPAAFQVHPPVYLIKQFYRKF